MGFINLPKATVERHLSTGTGYSVAETYTSRSNEVIKTLYTVWSSDMPEIGTVLKVSGKYSDKIAEIEGDEGIKRFVSRSINDPKVEVLATSTVPVAATAPAGSFIPADDDTPF